MAGKLVDTLPRTSTPRPTRTPTATRCSTLIKRKAEGKEIDLAAQEEPEHGDDLMAALEASLSGRTLDGRARSGAARSASASSTCRSSSSAPPATSTSISTSCTRRTSRAIEQRRFCKEEDVEVGWEEIARSYELDGKEVVITDEELASVEPRKTRTIEIETFVELAEVDPIYFDHPYFLVPAGESEGTIRAYRLLVEVMGRSERVAIGRFVMRTKEYLVAVRVRDGALALTTMRFADEVRPRAVPTGGKKPAKKEVDNAVAVIEELSTEWDPRATPTATASG